jgi:hypothetical protein
MPDAFPLFTLEYFACRHITLYRHISATTEEQVTALLLRVKELTGMPDSADLYYPTCTSNPSILVTVFYLHIFLTSNPCR